MKIDHIAIWCNDLEGMQHFYMHYFDASTSVGYYNHSKDFRSYFLKFDSDCTLELMQMPGIPKSKNDPRKQFSGIIHLAIKTGSKIKVDQLTEQLRADGFAVISEPRITGDGNYESVILDPEGNRVEIVA
ncbi:MAG: VOC family protein [Prolixibacteraceae bacterium]|jgi:lactoylglutathione lyase|nr:VOC family protein [Prolixibacteraceae bacterium]